MRKFNLILDGKQILINPDDNNDSILNIPIKKLTIRYWNVPEAKTIILRRIKHFRKSITDVIFESCTFENPFDLLTIFQTLPEITSVTFKNSMIDNFELKAEIPKIATLKSVSINDSDEYIYKFFENQISIERFAIGSFNRSLHGFHHEIFNDMVRTLPNINHFVFTGRGTVAYFDRTDYPFQVEKLEVESITFNWYVGIKSARNNFLNSQRKKLRELKIKQLPYDFDGGKILRFIIQKMDLKNFYYGDIPLILNWKKQDVKHISADETQILALFEMLQLFSGT